MRGGVGEGELQPIGREFLPLGCGLQPSGYEFPPFWRELLPLLMKAFGEGGKRSCFVAFRLGEKHPFVFLLFCLFLFQDWYT